MNTLQMIAIALYYALCVGVSPANSVSQFIGGLNLQPVVIGPIVGAILGDIQTGLAMGATIQLIYLGVISVGGETPSNPGIAAIMGVSLGIATGLDPEAAVSVAVPFGIIGSVLPTLVRNLHLVILHQVQKYIRKHNIKAANAWFFSAIPMRVVIQAVAVFLALLGGSTLLNEVLGVIPDSVLSALSVIGKVLPAVGFAVGVAMVCKAKTEIIFFVLAFLANIYLGLPVMVCTLVAVLYCILKYAGKLNENMGGEQELAQKATTAAQGKRLLSWGDLARYEAYRWFFGQNIMNYEDYNGTGKAICMYPLLKKLYPGNTDKQAERMEANMQYFNCNVHTESLIFGMVASMEEQKALGEDVPDEAISAVKTGLMGPLAGLGDPLVQGVITPLFITMALSLANQGIVFGGFLFPILYGAFTIVFAAATFALGYKGGKVVISKILSGNLMKYIVEIGSIIALASFGALAAQSIGVQVILKVNGVTIQSLLDTLLKGLLPLSLVLFFYSRLKKGTSTTKLIWFTFAAAFILGVLGVIG